MARSAPASSFRPPQPRPAESATPTNRGPLARPVGGVSSMTRFLFSLVGVGLLVVGAGEAKADYIFTTIDVPGAHWTEAHGINASGQIVGSYGDAGGPDAGSRHGFLLDHGSLTTLDVPGA